MPCEPLPPVGVLQVLRAKSKARHTKAVWWPPETIQRSDSPCWASTLSEVAAVERRYKKLVLGLYRRLRHPRHLKRSSLMRWFARHFLDKSVWTPSRHAFAGGLAVGFFVMMLLVPGQMAIAIVLAGMLRLNIPIAAAACWITNPFTFVPVVWWEIKLGNWLTELLGFAPPPLLEWTHLKQMVRDTPEVWELFTSLQPWAWSVYLGGVAAGLLLALLGYALSFLLWDLVLKLSLLRKSAKPDPPPPN
jgi:uncharacterized protein